jgi:hypothetical protein
MKRFLLAMLLSFFIIGEVRGGASQAGAIFLAIYPGARPNGMGTCFTGIADDAMASYYNDAGLGFQNKDDVTLMHSSWLKGLYPDMYYEYLGFVRNIAGGTIGGNIIYLTTGETDAVDPYGNHIAKFRSFDLSSKISYGTKISDNLSLGVGGKFIYSYLCPAWIIFKVLQEKGGGYGTSWGLDLSVLYKTQIRGLDLGASLQNLGPNISYLETGKSDPLPRTLRLGIAYKIIDTPSNRLRVSGELTKIIVGITRDINYEWKDTWKAVGIEYSFSDFLTVRAGYFRDKEGERVGPTFGGGLKMRGLRFDIGVDSAIYDFPTQNYRFSLNYTFEE